MPSEGTNGLLARVKKPLLRLANVLGMHSLRGRYLLVTGCFAFVLLGAVWLAEIRVGDATHRMLINDQNRQEIRRNNLRLLMDAVWAAENALQRHLLVSDKEIHDSLNHSLHRARVQVQRLQEYDWMKSCLIGGLSKGLCKHGCVDADSHHDTRSFPPLTDYALIRV